MNLFLFSFLIAFLLCALLWFFFITGTVKGGESFKEKAVKEGKAEYYLDENNDKQWRWKA